MISTWTTYSACEMGKEPRQQHCLLCVCKGCLHNRDHRAEDMTHHNVLNLQPFAFHNVDRYKHYIPTCSGCYIGKLLGNTLTVSSCIVLAGRNNLFTIYVCCCMFDFSVTNIRCCISIVQLCSFKRQLHLAKPLKGHHRFSVYPMVSQLSCYAIVLFCCCSV